MKSHLSFILFFITLLFIPSCEEGEMIEDPTHEVTHTVVNQLDVPVKFVNSKYNIQYTLTLLPEEEYTFIYDMMRGSLVSGEFDYFRSQPLQILISGYPEIMLYFSGHPLLNDKNGIHNHWEETGKDHLTLFINEEFISNSI